MSRRAVRAFVADQLSAIPGLQVYSYTPKLVEAADQVRVHEMVAREYPETHDVLKRVEHTVTLLALLIDAEARDAQETLDDWVQAIMRTLRETPRGVPLTDPVDGERSTMLWCGQTMRTRAPRAVDLGPSIGEEGDMYTSILIDVSVSESVRSR